MKQPGNQVTLMALVLEPDPSHGATLNLYQDNSNVGTCPDPSSSSCEGSSSETIMAYVSLHAGAYLPVGTDVCTICFHRLVFFGARFTHKLSSQTTATIATIHTHTITDTHTTTTTKLLIKSNNIHIVKYVCR